MNTIATDALARELARIFAAAMPTATRTVIAKDHAHAAGRDAHFSEVRKVGHSYFERCEFHFHFHLSDPRHDDAERGQAE